MENVFNSEDFSYVETQRSRNVFYTMVCHHTKEGKVVLMLFSLIDLMGRTKYQKHLFYHNFTKNIIAMKIGFIAGLL